MKTVRLRIKDLMKLRRSRRACTHCGSVFLPEDESFVVCEPCVRAAMESEHFKWRKKDA